MVGPGPADNLTKFPKGLISALGLRDFGSAPHALNNSLIGTIDALQLYLLNDRELVNLTGIAAPALGTNPFGGGTPDSVPNGELWYVWNYSQSIDVAAATAISFKPVVSLDNPNYFFGVATQYESGVALERLRHNATFPFWAASGTVFGSHVKSITGAPGLIDGRLTITRLRV